MSADPKPAPRAPKARKPLPRKRAAPRRTRSPRCSTRGCRQIARFQTHSKDPERCPWERSVQNCDCPRWCSKHARREADRLWSLRVRTGRCELREWHESLGVACGGTIVACHGFGRGYKGTRWLILNGFSGCSGINNWTEAHPLEWDAYLRSAWGEATYDELRRLALAPTHPDMAEVIASLTVPS